MMRVQGDDFTLQNEIVLLKSCARLQTQRQPDFIDEESSFVSSHLSESNSVQSRLSQTSFGNLSGNVRKVMKDNHVSGAVN